MLTIIGLSGSLRAGSYNAALLRAAKALAEDGITPPGVATAHQLVRSASVVLPPDSPFKEGAADALIAHPGVAPASV